MTRLEAVDDKIFEHELAVEEADAEPADMHLAADTLRALALGERTQPRTEVERQRRDNRHGERRRQHDDAQLREAKCEVRSDALEALEPQGHLVTTDLQN